MNKVTLEEEMIKEFFLNTSVAFSLFMALFMQYTQKRKQQNKSKT